MLQTQKSPLGVNLVGFQDFYAVGSVTAAKKFGLAESEWIAQIHVKLGFYPIQICPVYLNVALLNKSNFWPWSGSDHHTPDPAAISRGKTNVHLRLH
ncbi:hypothetical protein ACFL9S_20000 [Erwinia sp. AnSW2-5]|uniref:hypothetical protein n=1 Tax=Erwinia sp. AnSW2-5 TaxID=3367692 RepID=UPI00385972D4